MNQHYLDMADRNLPKLYETEITTDRLVGTTYDENNFFNAAVIPAGKLWEVSKAGERFTLDFGTHCVGYLSFSLRHDKIFLDAPVRLKLTFAEIPYELVRDLNDNQSTLCHSWFQEEIINIDAPGIVSLPRRYCFRYLRVEILAAPRDVILSDFSVRHVTSADRSKLKPLPKGTDPLLQKIDAIAAKTLEDCMQLCYEDGPKRDRRLWTGDLRLQALTDYYLFGNDKLARRCLYLFAACEEQGKYLPACLFQKPYVFYDEGMGVTDYALLFTVALCDYYEHTADKETAADIYPVAKRQIDLALSLIDENGVITFLSGWNGFIDWAGDVKRTTAIQGVLLYALERMAVLAAALGESDTADRWKAAIGMLRDASMKTLYNTEKGAFINAYDEMQYSVQAQVWMILGGVIAGEKGKALLTDCLQNAQVKPVTPYMHHYVVEAMIKLGMMEQALAYIKSYWGGMVENHADTFWEVYVPDDVTVSPYSDPVAHSFCHAWSCSPSYFIRKYFI